MNQLAESRLEDHWKSGEPGGAGGPLDPALFFGVWENTDADSLGVVKLEFTGSKGELRIRAYGAGDPEPRDWGEIEAEILADSIDSNEGNKFKAIYDFEFGRIRLHGWVKLGVLVIAVFNEFTDGSGRSNYFDRDFFSEAKG